MKREFSIPLIIALVVSFVGVAVAQDSEPPTVRAAGAGKASVAVTVPTEESKLTRLHVRSLDSKDVHRMITTLAFLDAASRRGPVSNRLPGYKCDSKTNKCTCNANDPLDCIEIYEECGGPLGPPGSPNKLCLPGAPGKTCECRWHLSR